ncbi:MAG: DNA-binding protein [Peptococcaceae bacterium BICA1-7]|nr:MAG: DNA-binding protein [Peptococcaceae bacterium BICA1-7]HBV97131.1 ATP-binding protein [Desulfotomaculum sp.]
MNHGSGGSSCEDKKSGGGCDSSQCGIERLKENDNSRIRNVIAVMSGKGGVGKSSVTSLLACELSKKGYRVGVLDADITGPSVPKMFGVRGMADSNGLAIFPHVSAIGIKIMSLNLLMPNEDDPVIWRGPIIAGAVKQFWTDVAWGDLDYLVVDLPPGTGDVPLTVMQSLPLNGVIVVTSPQDLASLIVTKAIKMTVQMSVPIIGLVENMSGAVCPHCGKEIELFGPGRGREMAKAFDIPFIGSIPLDPVLSRLCDEGDIEKYQSSLFMNIDPMALPQ